LQKTEKQPLETLTDTKEAQGMEKHQHDLGLVEAALYVAGRPLDLNELGSILKTRSKNRTKKLAKTLMQEYLQRNMALEILELKDEKYVLQLKADYTPHVKRLVNRPLLSTGPLKTLSYIAYRQPVSQKRVIDVRGHHAYGHVKMLKEMGLIASERSGRSWALRTTEYFADYFALSHDTSAMKRELKQFFEETAKTETLPA
jgi:segregation and condensation protein B